MSEVSSMNDPGDKIDILFLDKSRIFNVVNPSNVPFSTVDIILEPRYNLSSQEKLTNVSFCK